PPASHATQSNAPARMYATTVRTISGFSIIECRPPSEAFPRTNRPSALRLGSAGTASSAGGGDGSGDGSGGDAGSGDGGDPGGDGGSDIRAGVSGEAGDRSGSGCGVDLGFLGTEKNYSPHSPPVPYAS